jgi:hypothetical protein
VQAERTRQTMHEMAQFTLEMASKDASLKQMEDSMQSLRDQVAFIYHLHILAAST